MITDFLYSQRSPGVLAILGGKITMGRHVQLQKNSYGSEAFCSEGLLIQQYTSHTL